MSTLETRAPLQRAQTGAALRYTLAAALLALVGAAAWRLAPLPDGGRDLSLSLLLGAAFGIVLQRSRFCFYCIARDAIERRDPRGAYAVLVALAAITCGTLYQKRFCGGMDLRTGGVVQYLASGALLGLAALLFESREVQWSTPFVLTLGWLVLGLSFGAVGLLYTLIRHGAASKVASLFYLVPPVTALASWLLFDERLAPAAIGGMLLVMLGVALVNWPGRRA